MIILLNDNACPHTVNLTMMTLVTILGNHEPTPPQSPNLAPCGLHLFGLMKMHLRGQKFQTDDERGVLNWLFSNDKTLYVAGINNLPG
jgi:hypothetical protein